MLLKRLTFALSALLCSSQLAAFAADSSETIFENQCQIGRELRIPVHKWSVENRKPKAIIVAIPGLVFNGRAYDSMARHLTTRGYDVYSADMRGYGDWNKPDAFREFDGDGGVHYTQSKDDLTHLLQMLRKKYPVTPIVCAGESFGANYAVWEATTDPNLVDGVIASGLSYKICVHPRPRWFLTFFQGIHHPKKPLDLGPYLEPILSSDVSETKAALQHPDTMPALSVTDLIKAAVTTKRCIREVGKIPANMPILVVAGRKDAIQKSDRLPEFVAGLGSHRARLVLLPSKGHLLLEKQKPDSDVISLMDTWLCTELKSDELSLKP